MDDSASIRSVSPYLGYPDGDQAAQWLERVLGFGPVTVSRDDQGRWFEGEVQVGATRLHLNGSSPMEPNTGVGALLIVRVGDVDAQYTRIRAAGVELDPPRDEPYGPRTCHVTDPWGYRWYFWEGDAVYP